MPGKLTNFLSELAVNPEKLANYQKNPDAAMKDAGLDADECAALKSGDPARVYASLSGQSAPAGAAGANCIWGAHPQANCIWNAPPQANCIWGAQAQPSQANCIWGAQPQANCIWGAQAQAHCIWGAQPHPNCIWAAPPQPNCIWAQPPQPNCIWAQPPQPNCIWAQPPQPNCIWAPPTAWPPQPYAVVIHHHFIYGAPPQPSTPAGASEANQPGSQSPKGGSPTGKTS